MHIIRSWYDSLMLLLPSQLSLFGLVCLLSTYKTYQILVKNWLFWGAVLGMAIWGYFDQTMIQPYWCLVFTSGFECFFKRFIWHFSAFLLALILVLLTCAATRPSVTLKNTAYFNGLIQKGLSIITLIVAVQLLGYTITAIGNSWVMSMASVVLVSGWMGVSRVLYVLFFLFALDSDGALRSLLTAVTRAVVMFLYNLPLFVVINIVTHALQVMVCLLLGVFHLDAYFFSWFILWILSMPLMVNIWTNIYIKKLHEHPDLYFDMPK